MNRSGTLGKHENRLKRLLPLIAGAALATSLSLESVRADRPAQWFSSADAPRPLLALPADDRAVSEDWMIGGNLALVADDLLGHQVWENQGNGVSWIRSRRPVEGHYDVRVRVRFMDTHGQTAVRLATGARGESPDPETDYALTFDANRRATTTGMQQ